VVSKATRHISIDAIREAAFTIRGAANVVRQRSSAELAGGVWTVRGTCDEARQTVERHASGRMRGCVIHPFDDARFIAGNATLAMEILDERPGADAIVGSAGGGKSVFEAMWPLRRQVAGSIIVTLDEVAQAIRRVAQTAHVIAEGAAGCAVAAALGGRAGAGAVVAIVSGGNIDLPRFCDILTSSHLHIPT